MILGGTDFVYLVLVVLSCLWPVLLVSWFVLLRSALRVGCFWFVGRCRSA